ncbi:MAG: hypothetical protein KDH20_11645 [Rhodocyclaceae bacterium]|nr:hypothetical protein [Rhodocyclaceae bacterium]
MTLSLRLILLSLVLLAPQVQAEKVSDIRATKHNFSATAVGRTTGTAPSRNVVANSQTEVCVFCHTPHAANTSAPAPLWNREIGGSAYTPYTSSTLDAEVIRGQALAQPGGSSKLCLSCHDGTLAIGNVNVQAGQTDVTFSMSGTAGDGTMPAGQGENTGFTRDLGTDLTNDHPISVTFDTTLANRDGELRDVDGQQQWPANGSILGVRSAGYKPEIPLEPTGPSGEGQVQCASCHDPHLYDTDEPTKGPQKFLRQNRFQEAQPTDAHNPDSDIICLSCHDKNQGNASWSYSVHANEVTADETYKSAAAALREFPDNQPVWKAACLNCHDTHTVQGSRRLLREGTDSVSVPKAGGSPALEETCYQCHTTSGASILNTGAGTVPNIESDFSLSRHMPITTSEQSTPDTERHDINASFSDPTFIDCTGSTSACGKDFLEARETLGVGDLSNRHAECTDCHNPHRIIRNSNGLPGVLTQGNTSSGSRATHDHSAPHTNIISGALRGQWGVEPLYGSASFFALPSSYIVKRGDPGANTSTSAAQSYVTREYQICLKCHSDYGYTDDNGFPSGSTRPPLGGTNLTPSNQTSRTNYTRYTNQAREFQAPIGHTGQQGSTSDSGAGSNFSTNNHRGWHPVIAATGRDTGARGGLSANNWTSPFNGAVGTQTMYCSDCHGTDTANGTSAPSGSNPWGPHGSTNNFILKGPWDTGTGSGAQEDLCFKCHSYNAYGNNGGGTRTGFWIASGKRSGRDGHSIHSQNDKMSRIRCNWCHVAVPHGWKNKALLVNLNDAGPEVGLSPNTVIGDGSLPYSNGPYYRNAMLKIDQFRASGDWAATGCGPRGSSEDGATDWMTDTCDSPP